MITPMDIGEGDVLLSMFWFFLFIIWLSLLFTVFSDLFRSQDLSGWAKAAWTLFVIVLPYLGVLVYLIARGNTMGQHAAERARAQEAATRDYVRSVVEPANTADEIEKLAALRANGTLTDAEFADAKAKLLAQH